MGVRGKTRSRVGSLLTLSQLKMEAIRLKMEIPKLNGKEKKRAAEIYSKLFNEILRLEKIEEPVYLLRYE